MVREFGVHTSLVNLVPNKLTIECIGLARLRIRLLRIPN